MVELKRLQANVQAGSHVFVVVEGGSRDQQRAFGDALVQRLRAEAPAWLVDCEDGVQTTMLGYLALLGSVNQAIRSLGLLAVLGELGCLAAATLVLPAYLLWREQSDASRSPVPSAGSV